MSLIKIEYYINCSNFIMNKLTNKIVRTLTAIFLSAVFFLAQAPLADAARLTSISDLDTPRVSFTFDDGFASTRTLAAPILEARGIDGVLYLTSGVPDGTATLDDNQPGITWDQVRELQNDFGWEIGGHTVDHAEMPTITQAQNVAELTNSNAAFKANGLNVTNFASPFGAYDNMTLTEILKLYKSHRGFADRDALNSQPYHKDILMVQDVNDATTTAQVQAWVDQAITEKRWLILVFHDTAVAKNPNYEYTVTTANLTTMANYVQTKVAAGQIQVVTTEQGITIPGTNVLQNSGFEAGIANGWTTDNANSIKADNADHGNYGSPTQSVSLTGTATEAHLFYTGAQVSYNSSYVIDAFVNSLNLTSGELGFYVDEYDVNGTWLAGQWMGMATNGTIGFFTKLYNATSTLVNTIRVQVYLTAGATGTAYVDSVQVYNLDGTPAPTPTTTPTVTPTGTPSVTPTVTPTTTPAAGNIVVNGGFDSGLASWSTTDTTHIVAESGGITMTGNAAQMYLYQHITNFDNTARYIVSANFDTTGLTSGDLGYYVDEYDANGNWVSVQFWGFMRGGINSINRVYTASTNLVQSIRVHVFLTPGTTGTAKVDNVSIANENGANVTPTPTVVPTTTPSVTPTPVAGNIVANSGFDSGLASWSTTDTQHVAAENGTAKLTGMAGQVYLYQHINNFDNTARYIVSANFDTTGLTSGDLGYYVDEYDANGNWVSVQFWGFMRGAVNNISRVYTASTNLVNSIRVHAFLTAGSTGTATVDNISIADENAPSVTPEPTNVPTVTPTVEPTSTPSVTPTPTETPSVTPTPTGVPATNLVTNGGFETVSGDFAANWTHDTADFAIDTTSKGNEGTNSLQVLASTTGSHAFSDFITVTPGTTYIWSQFVSALTGTGEFGFYIDEYDTAGNWISGQWKGMITGPTTGIQSFQYVPTSTAVSQVRLQYYTTPSSTFNLYVDSVSLSN